MSRHKREMAARCDDLARAVMSLANGFENMGRFFDQIADRVLKLENANKEEVDNETKG